MEDVAESTGQGDRDKEYWFGGPLRSIIRSQWSKHVLANKTSVCSMRKPPTMSLSLVIR